MNVDELKKDLKASVHAWCDDYLVSSITFCQFCGIEREHPLIKNFLSVVMEEGFTYAYAPKELAKQFLTGMSQSDAFHFIQDFETHLQTDQELSQGVGLYLDCIPVLTVSACLSLCAFFNTEKTKQFSKIVQEVLI